MIHSVTGPVSADVLLSEANWAMELYGQAKLLPPSQQMAFVSTAHLQRGTRTNGQIQQVHQFLAGHPLAPLKLVYEHIFERILGQRVSKAGPRLAQAEAGLNLARKTGRPLLFVFHDGNDGWNWSSTPNRKGGGYGAFTSQMMNEYIVIAMPIREGPALSQLTKRPPYEAAGSRRPMFIVCRSDGEQIDGLAGWNDGYLARALAEGWVDALERNPPSRRTLTRATRLLNRVYPALAERTKELTIRLREDAKVARATTTDSES